MGCGGSKLDLSEAQSASEFLVEEMGRVSGQMDVTCSSEIKFERMKPSAKPILLMDASLGKDAEAFASVEKDSNGPKYNFICKDAKGTLVALMCITDDGGATNLGKPYKNSRITDITVDGRRKYSLGRTIVSTVYGTRPRVEGQASAIEHEGTPLFAWAQIKPTGEYKNSSDIWSSLGIHFTEGPTYTLEKQEPINWHVMNESKQGVAFLSVTRKKISVAAGVDPLIMALVLCEISAYDWEVNECWNGALR